MKAKKGFIVKTIATLISVALAVLGLLAFTASFKKTEELNAVGANFTTTERFTGVDENRLVFSIEKVAVQAGSSVDFAEELYASAEDATAGRPLTNYLLSNQYTTETAEDGTSYRDYKEYYYREIENGTNSKYVVQNGQFVMLNNLYNGEDDYYYNNNVSNTYNKEGNVVPMQEAIMISFGQFAPEGNLIAGNDKGANIGNVSNTVITHRYSDAEGDVPISVPLRSYKEFADFAMIIPQEEKNEGYWNISLNYMYNGVSYSYSFNFYLIFNSSYTRSVADGEFTYSASPNILCNGQPLINSNGYQYFLGDGERSSYPVLTYDYTKYHMSYTLTANGNTTNYNYTYQQYSAGLARLTCTATGANAGVTTYPMEKFNSGSTNNLVSVLLTDIGEYVFSFKYIYTGGNASNSPAMNLTIADQRLKISGVELNYSVNQSQTQMKYITIANNSNIQNVSFIAPGAYLRNNEQNTSLEGKLMLSYDTTSNARLGSTVETEGGDFNKELTTYLTSNDNSLSVNNVADMFKVYETTETTTNDEFLTKLLNYMAGDLYTRTNQGPISLKSNDDYDWSNSFYFYSKNPITSSAELNAAYNSFNRQTGFDKVGYYLVFIRLDNNSGQTFGGRDTMFAFQYNTDASNVTIKTDEQNPYTLYAGDFTNKDVIVSWAERGVFERRVNVSYYSSRTMTFTGTATDITNTPDTILEDGVYSYKISLADGYRHYRIAMNIEGQSTVYTDFTIDKEGISGVAVYEVEQYINLLGNTAYQYVTNGRDWVEIETAITNALAGIYWNDKGSGASIEVTYTLTEFVANNDEITESRLLNNLVWHNTPYQLGTTSNRIYDITTNKEINVLSKQGIYVFTFKDQAGNSCNYMFVIDKTENYFKITDNENNETFANTRSLTYYDDVTITAGTHKTIDLGVLSNNSELNNLITLAGSNAGEQSYRQANYYVGEHNNYEQLNKLFTTVTSTGNTFFTVENKTLTVFDHMGQPDTRLTINISASRNSVIMQYVESNSSSMIRRFYLSGVNNRLSVEEGSSFITIEINKDSSRGMVFYSNDESNFNNEDQIIQAVENIDDAKIHRLWTGSDTANSKGIDAAFATSDNFVAFTWFEGEGVTKVTNVNLRYYALGEQFNNDTYYYTYASETILYDDGSYDNSVNRFTDGDGKIRYYAVLNKASGWTREGLYVISRSYATSTDTEAQTLNYYFIVDRNGIIEPTSANATIIGSNIRIDLMEETSFNSFNSYNVRTETLVNAELESSINYSIYLNNTTATKLPAVLKVPVSKYFNGTNLNSYYAGRLQVSLYFNDTNKQLTSFDRSSYKLYQNTNDVYTQNGTTYFDIDITQSLPEELREHFLTKSGNTSWLTLPGDYVLIINDMVEGSNGTHQKVIGFRINGSANLVPNVDVFATSNKDVDSAIVTTDNKAQYTDGEYYLTTNKEFVKIELPAENKQATTAQINNEYIKILSTIGNDTTNYLTIENGIVTGTSTNSWTRNEDGSLSVVLDTYLRNGSNIATDYLKSLTYTITIRYNYTDEDAYHYYQNDERQHYYETVYTVIIDRVAPQENITELQKEEFLKYYKNDNIFEDVYQDNGEDGVIFVTRYADYYKDNKRDVKDIYAFRVDANTAFNNEDVNRVYVRQITDITNFTLADLWTSGYVTYTPKFGADITTYGALFNTGAGYYEVVEADANNNLTQYVVFYDAGGSYENIQLGLTYIGVKPDGITGETYSSLGAVSDVENTLTIHSFESVTISGLENIYDAYYHFELVNRLNNQKVGEVNTYLNTSFNDNSNEINSLANDIINMFVNAGFGNYKFSIYTRGQVYNYSINYYETHRLSIEKLVEEVDGGYALYLNNANEWVGDAYYYATRIEISRELEDGNHSTTVYVYREDAQSGEGRYYLENDTSANPQSYNRINLNGTYSIKMTDSNGNKYSYKFSTEQIFYYDISFGKDGNGNAYVFNNNYYTFNDVQVRYNTLFFNARIDYSINNSSTIRVEVGSTTIDGTGAKYISADANAGIINIAPYFENKAGGLINAVITLFNEDGENEFSYNIIIDTRFGSAATLVDGDNKPTAMEFDTNVNFVETTRGDSSTGTRYLKWVNTNSTTVINGNDTFKFTYTLYEELTNGQFITTEFTYENSKTIEPSVDSTGIFRFVIEAYSPDEVYMGNVVYTFFVQAVANDLYTVSIGSSLIEANSSLTLNELITDSSLAITREAIASQMGIAVADLPAGNLNIDLYVYNKAMSVDKADNADKKAYEITFNGNVFGLYRISRGNDIRFVATLQIEEYSNLVNTIQINGSSYNHNGQTLTGADNYILTFNRVFNSINTNANTLMLKDTLQMEIYYYGSYVKTENFTNGVSNFSYELEASGQYGLKFKDLAGNVAEITFSLNGDVSDMLNVTLLREVAVSVNGMAPIPNGYYNDAVTLAILNANLYNSRDSITVTYAYNAGSPTVLTSNTYSYTFTQPGWYRVVVSAVLNNQTLTRTIEFTIVNPNEAFTLFGLSNRYINVTQVLNINGEDVTDAFMNIVNSNNGIVTYDSVLANAYNLGISYGKQVFAITYTCEDGIYPAREVTFRFTLNNETPKIDCSLVAGASTTKGFNITFNAGEIYRQVGDCSLIIYKDSIGGTEVYRYNINLNTTNIENWSKSRTGETDDGAYYIVLISASGNIKLSSKVYIKEPLNSAAIIIIVIVVVIVTAVVVAIVLLRRRMRIR